LWADRLSAFVAYDSTKAIECTWGMPPERAFAFGVLKPRFKVAEITNKV